VDNYAVLTFFSLDMSFSEMTGISPFWSIDRHIWESHVIVSDVTDTVVDMIHRSVH